MQTIAALYVVLVLVLTGSILWGSYIIMAREIRRYQLRRILERIRQDAYRERINGGWR